MVARSNWKYWRLRTISRTFSTTGGCNNGRSSQTPFRLAIVGSGPAGFYTAYRVMSRIPLTHVDMFESLPVPYGLVRHGVAPDHPEVKSIKNCQEKFEQIASSPTFRFFGNVSVGQKASHNQQGSVKLQSLLRHYDCVLLAYGACEDKELGIPGELALKGIHSARQFVGWYNGLPEGSSLNPLLDKAEDAVVIGHGNVALDVARILLEDVDVLRKTDIAAHALEILSRNRIKRVHVVGRRGPIQSAFTIKEVRELMRLPHVSFHPFDRTLIPPDLHALPRVSRRLMELILKGSAKLPHETSRSWSLDYCLSPSRFFGHESFPTTVASTKFNVMKLNEPYDPTSRSFTTGQTVHLPSDIVFRSVGYKSAPLPEFSETGIEFNKTRGVVMNDGLGRVTRTQANGSSLVLKHLPGVYCAGWVKRGPTGVIASTMQDAFMTGEAIVQDWNSGAQFLRSDREGCARGWEGLRHDIETCAELAVSWDQWLQIDKAEKQRGKEQGKQREKFSSIQEMLNVVR
ncbi:hypothetical protein E4U19_006920 [Claviceps sp. Clav32 group G5]|nr:hypothetical protein E4U40_007340 [Claviceps sp. LM458 group G5]KAG6019701.1 hypothetical protein E4U19_006920 [Claviceps sp. Clav32 group G5]KAG6041260.1 hypothetical protein E4U39_006648 [Claviceps sp. Clav50 group G5]